MFAMFRLASGIAELTKWCQKIDEKSLVNTYEYTSSAVTS